MNTRLAIAGAVVGIVALAVAVVALAQPTTNVERSPTFIPAAPPTAADSGIPAQTLPPSGELPAGTYRSDFLAARDRTDFVDFTLPAGWKSDDGIGAVMNASDPAIGLGFYPSRRIATIYADPCHWQQGIINIDRPGVSQFVAAFEAQKRASKVTPVAVSIGGFNGQELDLVVPVGTDIGACDGGEYKAWTESPGVNGEVESTPGRHELIDIVSVSGQTMTILRDFPSVTPPAALAELRLIVGSIRVTTH
jgi:hypothetical protein